MNAAPSLPGRDALAVLRAHAHTAGTSVDELADQVLSRRVPVDEPDLDSDRRTW